MTEWRDHVFKRLRDQPPGVWILAGELFDEVRTDIPPQHAMRRVIRQTRPKGLRTRPVPLDKATWLYYASALRQMDIERETHDGKPCRVWNYRDRIRIKTADWLCPECGGPMVRKRGSGLQRTSLKNYECQVRCGQPPKKPLMPKPEPPEPAPEPAPQQPQPNPAVRTNPDPYNGLFRPRRIVWRLTALEGIPQREIARNLKRMMPNGGAISLNRIERLLEVLNNDVAKVCARFGVSVETLIQAANLKAMFNPREAVTEEKVNGDDQLHSGGER